MPYPSPPANYFNNPSATGVGDDAGDINDRITVTTSTSHLHPVGILYTRVFHSKPNTSLSNGVIQRHVGEQRYVSPNQWAVRDVGPAVYLYVNVRLQRKVVIISLLLFTAKSNVNYDSKSFAMHFHTRFSFCVSVMKF